MTLSELYLAFQSLESDLLRDLKLGQGSTSTIQIEENVKNKIKNWPRPLAQRLLDELFDFGPLKALLADTSLNEVLVLDFDNIVVEKGHRLEKAEDHFLSPWTYRNFVQRLFTLTQAKTDLNHAAVDTQLNEFRIHIIQKPLVNSDFQISFRRHPKIKWNFEMLCNSGTLTSENADLLKQLIDEKKNLLIAGPTGSGKTTLLKACLNELPQNERVVVIEDTHEIDAPNEFSSHLLCRQSESDHLKNFTLSDLLRQSLRMRPDRLVVGEVRGGEAKDLLLALSTGHGGSFGTLHAASVQETLFRLEFLIQMGAPQWSLESIRRLIFLSLQNIVIVGKSEQGRSVKAIHRLTSLETSGILTEQMQSRALQPKRLHLNNYPAV